MSQDTAPASVLNDEEWLADWILAWCFDVSKREIAISRFCTATALSATLDRGPAAGLSSERLRLLDATKAFLEANVMAFAVGRIGKRRRG